MFNSFIFLFFITATFCYPKYSSELNTSSGLVSTADSDPDPIPIHPELYADLITYSKLIDISYCISPWSRIQHPFQCEGDCSKFHNTELIYQWDPNDITWFPLDVKGQVPSIFSSTGYIAISHEMKSIIISLRGTRSFKDTLIDINADMVPYGSFTQIKVMKVHRGFYLSYLETWDRIKWHLMLQISNYPNYKLIVMGHSLGGAIANFLTLRIVEEGIKNEMSTESGLLGVSMGQPMIGNLQFTNYVNCMLGLQKNCPSLFNSYHNPVFVRVTHKNDPVVQLPWLVEDALKNEEEPNNAYSHCDGEVYINELGSEVPLEQNVYYCNDSKDTRCSYGDSKVGLNPEDSTEHLNYFKRMGICGFRL